MQAEIVIRLDAAGNVGVNCTTDNKIVALGMLSYATALIASHGHAAPPQPVQVPDPETQRKLLDAR